MNKASYHPVSLDDCGAANWMMEGVPASIINPDASLHRCIAWCWSEVDSLSGLAQGLGDVLAPDSPALCHAVATIFEKRTQSLMSMLEYAARLSYEAERAQSQQTAAD